jgi:DnaJ-class molecular chaperone
LAMEHHPDHGGAADKMRELNLAYERILRHRAERRAERVAVAALPTRAR